MPSSPNINSDAPATFAAYAEIAEPKLDEGATVPDADSDQYVTAAWGNFVDECIRQQNEVNRGTRFAVVPYIRAYWGQWTTGLKMYLDPVGVTEVSPSTYAKEFIAPCAGWLQRVSFLQTAGGGDTDIFLHVNGVDGTPVTVPGVLATTRYHADFGTSHSFAKGDTITVGFDPTDASGPGALQATAVFMLDLSTM